MRTSIDISINKLYPIPIITCHTSQPNGCYVDVVLDIVSLFDVIVAVDDYYDNKSSIL